MSTYTKNKLILYSETFSLWSTVIMCSLAYVPFYQEKIYKITLFINILKCLNFINCDFKQIIHHIAGLFLTTIIYNSRPITDPNILYDINVGVKANISTIFLVLMYQNKQNIKYKILFPLTFFIYRIPLVYLGLRNINGMDYMCTDNIIGYNYCYYSFYICYKFLAILNVYWMYLIILKIIN